MPTRHDGQRQGSAATGRWGGVEHGGERAREAHKGVREEHSEGCCRPDLWAVCQPNCTCSFFNESDGLALVNKLAINNVETDIKSRYLPLACLCCLIKWTGPCVLAPKRKRLH